MSVLIGGSGSTGSSLLRTVLNRHPDLFAGEELNFFNKEQYFENWPKYRRRCFPRFHRNLATKGWFPWPGNLLLHKDYGWNYAELRDLIEASATVVEFANGFFQRPLAREGAKIWLEKTPSNCYSFRHFLNAFEQGKVVHVTRNPLDAVASLVGRGMNTYFAAGLWVYNTAAALSAAESSRYTVVRYEDLVTSPSQTIGALTAFLGVTYDERMLQAGSNESTDHTRNRGWTYERTKEIGSKSIGRFNSLEQELQREIVTALSALEISVAHMKTKGLSHSTCGELCTALGYEFARRVYQDCVPVLTSMHRKDVWSRTKNRYPTHVFYYPVTLALGYR